MDDVTPPFTVFQRFSNKVLSAPDMGGKKKLVGLIVCIGSLSGDHQSSRDAPILIG